MTTDVKIRLRTVVVDCLLGILFACLRTQDIHGATAIQRASSSQPSEGWGEDD